MKDAFEAIKRKDWRSYSGLTITTADIALRKEKISPFKEKLSFMGGVLKPRQQEELRLQFEKASAGAADDSFIDFQNSDFVRAEEVDRRGESIGFTAKDEALVHRLYAVTVRHKGKLMDGEKLSPKFELVYWRDRPWVLKLVY